MKKVKMHCVDCQHECNVEMDFSNVDSPSYIKSVIDIFTCPVVDNQDCNWVLDSIGGASIK